MLTKRNYALLTGGLGNQLFQYSFLLSRKKSQNFLVTTWGKPRLNSEQEPEINSFHLDSSCDFNNPCIDGLILQKSIGYVLRSGFSPKPWERGVVRFLARVVVSIEVSIVLRHPVSVRGHKSLGYNQVRNSLMPSFDVGYFQSYKWASEPEIFGKMMNLRLRDCKKIEKIKELAEREKPVIVHFRFGDYLAEENFGIPSSQYYREAVNAIRERTSRDRTFWIFSDDVEKAKVIIDEISLQKTKYFSSNQFSSSETFEIMRMGTDYVIANSTFSWWAAFLRYSRAGIVVAPTPWFKGLPTPADLIPLEWIQIEAVF